MIRTLYFSTAAADLSHADVEGIVSHAREANAKRGVTGALAYNGRNFCQLLEGETDTVMALIDRISRDPRHDGFKVIDQKEISERFFPRWSMQLVEGLDFSSVINAMKE